MATGAPSREDQTRRHWRVGRYADHALTTTVPLDADPSAIYPCRHSTDESNIHRAKAWDDCKQETPKDKVCSSEVLQTHSSGQHTRRAGFLNKTKRARGLRPGVNGRDVRVAWNGGWHRQPSPLPIRSHRWDGADLIRAHGRVCLALPEPLAATAHGKGLATDSEAGWDKAKRTGGGGWEEQGRAAQATWRVWATEQAW